MEITSNPADEWIPDIIHSYWTVLCFLFPPVLLLPVSLQMSLYLSPSSPVTLHRIVFCAVTTKCHNDNLSRKWSIQWSQGLNKSTIQHRHTRTRTHTHTNTNPNTLHQPVNSYFCRRAIISRRHIKKKKRGKKKQLKEMLPKLRLQAKPEPSPVNWLAQ